MIHINHTSKSSLQYFFGQMIDHYTERVAQATGKAREYCEERLREYKNLINA